MKKIIRKLNKIALLGAACVALTGCNDFLDIIPKDMVTEDNFWDEKTDVEQMVFGCYEAMQSDAFISRAIAWGEMRSDNLYNGTKIQDDGSLYEIMRENLLSTNAYTSWTPIYAVINRCNQIIAKAPEVAQKDPTYTSSEVQATIAEMTAIRSLCYFYLIRAFEDVPYYTNAVKQEDQVEYLPTTSFNKVLENIIADLESVRNNAYKVYPNEEYNTGRITQDAIHAMLADMCLWKQDYKKAEQYCQLVIDSKYQKYYKKTNGSSLSIGGGLKLFKHNEDTGNGYPLYPNSVGMTEQYGNAYNAIFGEGCSEESIFELSFTPTGDNGNKWVENSAVGRLFGEFTGRDKSNMGMRYLNPPDIIGADLQGNTPQYFTKKDSRFYENIMTDKDFTSFNVAKWVYNFVYINKVGTDYTTTRVSDALLDANWIFYRLTDVMLMQAEAYVHQMADDNSEEDKELLRKAFYLIYAVNARSFMGNINSSANSELLQLSNYPTKDLMNELVLKERHVELMFEGKRWFDLVRQARRDGNTQIVRSKVQPKFTASSSGSVFVSMASLYWPYNKNEVKLNPYLNQKPYYANETEDSYESTN